MSKAPAILVRVSVVVTVIEPFSSPMMVARDTFARFASSPCVKPFSLRASLILKGIRFHLLRTPNSLAD
nr:MAG TPA: hypothetical protein [Caudoviricetes sp.]